MSATNKNQQHKLAKTTNNTLERLVLANLLWESQFYIDGKSTAELIQQAVQDTDAKVVNDLAIRARSEYNLRHTPLLLVRELARQGRLHWETLYEVIQRADEISEFVSLYWQNGKCALSNQTKRGLAAAFNKFSEYQFAKWDKNNRNISLRDVMFLVHPKPATQHHQALFQKIANRQLATPFTWETELSRGADKRATFTRLMLQKELGALAFIRNLRNMAQCAVEESLILDYSTTVDVSRVLPFRFIAAARQVPQFEFLLEQMMYRALSTQAPLRGKTVLLVDVSGSMFGTKVSNKSDLDRFDAAAALAVLCREICEQVEVYSFSDRLVRVPDRRGFSLVDALKHSQSHRGTQLGASVTALNQQTDYNRIIVFTDEQSNDVVPKPQCHNAYVLNVGAYQNGIETTGQWHTVTGFSEAVVRYIQALEG